MKDKGIIRRIGFWCGILAVFLLAVSIVSGFGWDLLTSDFITGITGGLLDRFVSAELHKIVLIPMVFFLALHIILGFKRKPKDS